jgi:hypothetical protein
MFLSVFSAWFNFTMVYIALLFTSAFFVFLFCFIQRFELKFQQTTTLYE